MAKLNLSDFRAARDSDVNTKAVKVGNNRTVRKMDGFLMCFLYDKQIVTFGPTATVVDTQGYATATTQAAIKDFLEAFDGRRHTVSRAKGILHVDGHEAKIVGGHATIVMEHTDDDVS